MCVCARARSLDLSAKTIVLYDSLSGPGDVPQPSTFHQQVFTDLQKYVLETLGKEDEFSCTLCKVPQQVGCQ